MQLRDSNYLLLTTNDGSTKISKYLNEPRGIQIGPLYEGATIIPNSNIIDRNNTPEITITNNTNTFNVKQNTTLQININTSDQDDDPITISLDPDMIPPSNIILTDNSDGIGIDNIQVPIGVFVE